MYFYSIDIFKCQYSQQLWDNAHVVGCVSESFILNISNELSSLYNEGRGISCSSRFVEFNQFRKLLSSRKKYTLSAILIYKVSSCL